MSITADLALPGIAARRSPGVRARQSYVRRLQATAEHDPAVAAAFIAVAGMRKAPTHLLRPAVVARVLRGSHRRTPSHPPVTARRHEPATRQGV
jgi:hypothetical protein